MADSPTTPTVDITSDTIPDTTLATLDWVIVTHPVDTPPALADTTAGLAVPMELRTHRPTIWAMDIPRWADTRPADSADTRVVTRRDTRVWADTLDTRALIRTPVRPMLPHWRPQCTIPARDITTDHVVPPASAHRFNGFYRTITPEKEQRNYIRFDL